MNNIPEKQPEMAQIDLTKPTFPDWWPDLDQLRQEMLEWIAVPEDRFNNFKEIK